MCGEWAFTINWIPLAWVLFPEVIHFIRTMAFHKFPSQCTANELRAFRRPVINSKRFHGQVKKITEVGPPSFIIVILNNVAQLFVAFHILVNIIVFTAASS